jgi:hypothetical protein
MTSGSRRVARSGSVVSGSIILDREKKCDNDESAERLGENGGSGAIAFSSRLAAGG